MTYMDKYSSSDFLNGGVLPAYSCQSYSRFHQVLLTMITNLALPERKDFKVDLYPNVTFPLFITNANYIPVSLFNLPCEKRTLELMESAVLLFFGAIFAPQWCIDRYLEHSGRSERFLWENEDVKCRERDGKYRGRLSQQ
jgi:hypothetical protein